MKISNLGSLYVVATPIGNLQDMSFRAIDILKKVDLIAAEDTRHSLPLLRHFGISTPLISLHDHNEQEQSEQLLKLLEQGKSIALISDAGTPLISDPGYSLVRTVRAAGIRVIPIPGACAAITALSVSGLPTDRFVFEGFLPTKTKGRLDQLTALSRETRTLVFYEAPHRILDTLQDMQTVFGHERKAVIARELTKVYETIHSGSLAELIEWVSNDSYQQRGEIVILVQGTEEVEEYAPEKVLAILLKELPVKQAVELAVSITGARKNTLYDLALSTRKK